LTVAVVNILATNQVGNLLESITSRIAQ